MKIIVAKTAGFCMGVKRAVDLALEHSGKTSESIHTIGPLIHNKQTIELLKQRGVTTLKDSQPIENSTLLIRAHGIPPSTQKQYADQKNTIIDGTCPKVKTVHKVIERYRTQDYQIIITGDEGHAEVIGLLGYAGDKGILIQHLEDIEKLPEYDKICLVSQTTFDRILFDLIAARIREKYAGKEIIVKKTICAATDQRQAETEVIAKQVEALIVVGGKNSANTQRLAKIGQDAGIITQHVETEDEINWNAISHCKVIGITAGASTPTWMIKRVQDYLNFMTQKNRRSLKNILLAMFDRFANLNFFVSLGAVTVYFASCYIQDITFNYKGSLIAFFYFISMYLWNSLASIESMQHLSLSRYKFYVSKKRLLYSISLGCAVLILLASLFVTIELFYLTLFATIAGLAYHLTIIPGFLKAHIPYRSLKDIPTSRDLFVALAWATVLTFLPQAIEQKIEINMLTIGLFVWIFILSYFRALIFDLRDIEGDRIMGRETLITIIGEKRARQAIVRMTMICFVLLLIVPSAFGFSVYKSENAFKFFFQIPVLLYIFLFVKTNWRIGQNSTALFNLLTDGLFYLAGLGAFIASFVLR
jgi:4-hydroxy-3-methylbut-2-enyl diphosphate reductase